MDELLGLVQLSLLAAVGIGGVAALSSRLLYPRIRRRLSTLPPVERASWLFSWLVAPAALGPLVTLACFLPWLLHIAFPSIDAVDHCLGHHDIHAHFCFLHPPAAPGSALGWALIAIFATVGLIGVFKFLLRIRSSQEAIRSLLAAAEHDPNGDLLWISSAPPLALLAGILRPRLIVSKSLRDALAPELLHAVVLHERAHARRHDVMQLAGASLLSLLHFPKTRRELLHDFRLACEQAADAEAAAVMGDPLSVADAILKVQRLALGVPEFGVLARAFGEGDLEERIHALLAPVNITVPALLRAKNLAALAFCGILLASGPLHHLVETAVGLLTH